MGNFFITLINFIISALGTILNAMFSVLPNSPFTTFNNSSVSNYLGGLAWIIPFDGIISVCELWLSAILVYYGYQIVMRWLKAIG